MTDRRPPNSLPLADSDVVSCSEFAAEESLRHGFFTRRGGVSRDIYETLNMGIGSKDDPGAVQENRSRAMQYLGLQAPDLATPWQVHCPDAVIVEGPFAGERPRADGIVTKTPGLAVGVVTADCGPILFADAGAGVVGAAHAGWRGAVGGVIEATVAAMERCGARREAIVGVLGPTITQPSYEVGTDMMDAVLSADAEAATFFEPGASAEKRRFDLPGYIVGRLLRSGVSARFVGLCTYAEEDRFFSFRRTTHRGEIDYGRQLAAIAINA